MIATDRKNSAAAAALAWCADCGDGTYRNPVLFADYSDPDAIRVGEDFWLTSSSFSHVPGLPILHSRDLVNWTIVNHALPALMPTGHFSRPRHGGGVWAPAIRHHAGRFWIFYPDPDFGLYAVTAEDPRARWSAPVLVKSGRGLIDPCPFWDDDGAGYLIHGWARSRSGINNRVTLHRLAADGLAVLDEGEVIIDGEDIPGWHTIEGPKLYKRAGYYYVFVPAGGVRDGFQAVFRARSLRGPFERRVVLAQGRTPVNGPHQGAWVDTPAGEHWFLHFQEQAAYGRVVHLQPMRWENDWPLIGEGHVGDGPGEPVLAHRKPFPGAARAAPATTDEFDKGSILAPQWQWQANPNTEWYSLTARRGALRLACVPEESNATLWSAGHLLLQKFPAPEFEVTTQMRFSAAAVGARAGLVVFGYDYAWLGLRHESSGMRIVLQFCLAAHEGGAEREMAANGFGGESVYLRVTIGAGAECRFSYSSDGIDFQPFGATFRAKPSSWVGAKVGLFASSPAAAGGHADVSWFRVAPANVEASLDDARVCRNA
jgi:beta-xylosidase